MKKIFSFFAAVLLAFTANAAVIAVSPDSPNASDNIRRALRDKAQAGDVLALAEGTYVEAESIVADKDITIMPADGAEGKVILQLGSTAYIKVANAANVIIKGIKFDGATNSTANAIRAYDVSASKLTVEDCEFIGFVKYVITSSESNHIDQVVVNNCFFHNSNVPGRSAIYFPQCNVENQQTISALKVTNCTFANNDVSGEYAGVVDVRSNGLAETNDIEVLVDHCTFYNNATKNSDYADVNTRIVNKTVVSNCIFAHSEAYERRATYLYAGEVKNSITFNLTKDASQDGHTWMTTRTACSTADPLFTDAANGDLSFAGDWTTMELSPARGAATDGSDLGDPRWYSDEVLPSVDFASPYQFVGAKALLAGNIQLNDNKNIEYIDTKDKGTATWKIHATKTCELKATLNMEEGSSSGHNFKIQVIDAAGELVGELAEEAQNSHDGNLELAGSIVLPAEGNFIVRLFNLTEWSSAKIAGITVTAIVPVELTTIYCKMDQEWWTQDGAAVGIYTWDEGGVKKAEWPGERMTPVEGEDNVWSFDLDLNTYKMCIFTRVNGSGDIADWGAKTKDLTIPTDGKNLFTIADAAVWGDPGCEGEWSVFGEEPKLEAPDAAPAAPEWPANQVKAVYSATYGADCGFGEWESSTAYTQESFGKKYVTTNLGYFGMTFEDNALNCSAMEKFHLDIWIAADASVRVVPIWDPSANIGVTLNLEGQKWNSFDIALSEFDGVPDWSNIYQIKIDEARELTFWVNNVFFYTTVAPAVDETAPADVTASATASYFSATITAKATDASGAVIFTVKNGDDILAVKSAASDADAAISVKGLKPNTEYNLSVIAADESGNAAEPVVVATKTLVAPAAAPAPEFKADDVKSIFSDAYTAAPASIGTMIAGWWEPTELSEGELADGDHALFYAPKATGMFGWEFAELDATGFPYLHIDIYPLADGSIMIYPVDNIDPKQEYKETVSVKGGEWNNVVIDLTGKDLTKINQIGWINYYALNGFFVDNVYFSKDAEPVVPQLNIYASGLTAGEVADGKVTVSYVLNAKATAVEIQLITTEDEVVKTFESAGKAKGLNSCELDLNGIEAATYKWAVKATSWPTKEMINVLDYDKKLYNFYLPQGLAIDNSTDSPFFGRIYVSESIDGLSDGATDRTKSTKQGIFIYDPLLTDVTSQGVVGYKGSLKCASGSTDRNSFKRVVVDKDGFVYVNSMDANVGGVYRMDPANPTADFVAVLDTTKRGTLYSPISSILVEGQGEDKVLYTAENFAASLSTGSIKKYAIGNTTNFANEAETVILNSSSYGLGISDNQFVSDGRGGFWGCQNRWGYDGFAAVYHINAAKERDYAIMKDMNTNVLPETSDVTTYRGVIAINESKTQIAIPTRGRVIVFNVAYDASTGVPTLTEAYRVSDAYGTKSNIDGIAFDRADNLYVVSASKEKLYVYATVKANNNCTTPAPSSKPIILKATGSAIEDSFAPVKAQKIFRNGEVLIIRDGKTYNMMGQIVR